MSTKYEQMRAASGDAHVEVKKMKEARHRLETSLTQKFMKLTTMRKILGDALVANFQVC